MSDLRYMKDEAGVHVMHPTEEGTLCGTYDSEHNYLEDTKETVVTCRLCIRLLTILRTIKIGTPVPEKVAYARANEREGMPI